MRVLVHGLQHSYVNYAVSILNGCSFWIFKTNIQNTISHVLPAVAACTLCHLVVKEEQWCKVPAIRFAWLFGATVISCTCTRLPGFFLFSSLFKPFSQWQLPCCKEKGTCLHMHRHTRLPSEGTVVWFQASLAGFCFPVALGAKWSFFTDLWIFTLINTVNWNV